MYRKHRILVVQYKSSKKNLTNGKILELSSKIELLDWSVWLRSIKEVSAGLPNKLCVRGVNGTIEDEFEIFQGGINSVKYVLTDIKHTFLCCGSIVSLN